MNAEKQSQLKITSQVWLKSNCCNVLTLCLWAHKVYSFIPCEFESSVNYFLPFILHYKEWVDVSVDVIKSCWCYDSLLMLNLKTLMLKILKLLMMLLKIDVVVKSAVKRGSWKKFKSAG